ncbi:MAG TPA: FtsX-like permease family protein, partial [Burkholderiaceae bacterium]
MQSGPAAWLLAHFAGGYLRARPWRALVQVAAIAAGVALGFAVDLINASALAEFSSAQRSLSGAADLSVLGPAGGFDEAWYGRIATDPAVAFAAPMLEVNATLVDAATPGTDLGSPRGALRIVGIDALRSALIEPDLVGAPAGTGGDRAAPAADGLLSDGLFASPAALAQLHRSVGDEITVVVGDRRVRLRIAGPLPAARDAVATMDLGFAQWRLDRLGLLTRIDVKFVPGANIATVAREWHLPPGMRVESVEAAIDREQGLSRAYRVNLDVLSMIALFTGAFLVFSLQSQAVVARRAQLALLRMLGARRADVARLLVAESAVLGVIGTVLGLAAGAAVADAALQTLGGDLGGGYFSGIRPHIAVEPARAAVFFALGLAASIGGAWVPAREAAAEEP